MQSNTALLGKLEAAEDTAAWSDSSLERSEARLALAMVFPDACYECQVEAQIEAHGDAFLCVCPVCGCSINPQSSERKAVLVWNAKQQYLKEGDEIDH